MPDITITGSTILAVVAIIAITIVSVVVISKIGGKATKRINDLNGVISEDSKEN